MLVWTQVLSALQSLALAVLALTGTITVGWILVLQVVQGVINAFDTPARQAFVVQMVDDRADLPNAIALNSTMVNGSRIIGPSIGGIIIAAVGEGWCFMIDAISYIAVIVVAARDARVTRSAGDRPATVVLASCATAFATSSAFAPVRTALILLAIVSAMGMPYTVLMPVIASHVLHGGAHTLGFLMTASGLGAVAGALYLASRRERARTRPGDGRRDAGVRRWAHRVRLRANALARARRAAVRRRRLHGRDGVDEHDPANDYRGASARPRDGVLHDGVSRHRADRQSCSPASPRIASVHRRRSSLGGVACIAGGRMADAARCRSFASTFGRSTSKCGILAAAQADVGKAPGMP